ncbi:APHP domain protein [Pseudobacteroides cellulosolvens ATCC 35603 = DSM 2933]|uniref:APHP domain protein n=2 Tax=Pseudobacteroides cellulosolvens TaxID=35825 RepID=A0A0L6JKB5_9FIRM|nr:APHP domain protein [Pseudobacteroides cellulosolvens ATCC 35603 = DSM 2933]
MGFLVGFYIDNQYIGYTRVDKNIELGETVKVPYTWVATPGVHVLKVVANDILDILKETDKKNNSTTVALTTKQVNFADIAIDSVAYVADGENLNSEMPFAYRAKISNTGTANAEKFSVSLYIDGKWVQKQSINLLKPGAETYVTFIVKPSTGSHEITVKADDPSPLLKEIERENNELSIVTPEFTVSYPKISLGALSWMPQESVITEGTSLTFSAKVTNNSTTDITHEFNVDFIVDGQKFKTVTLEKLGAGEVADVTARWTALPGTHKIKVCADSDNVVTEDGTLTAIESDIPSIRLIYPDLYISDVTWSPTNIKYGDQVTFIARVSNQSVTSVFKNFNVSLYMDGKQVAGKTVNGIRGHSTAIVDLTWKANLLGSHNFKIVIDNEKALILEPLQEGLKRVEEGNINISDSLMMEAHPNNNDADLGFMSSLFIADDDLIPVSVKVTKASSNGMLLGTEDGIGAMYSLVKGNEKVSGELGFDKVSRTFKTEIPISNLSVGNYILTLEAGDGVEKLTSTCNISIMPETIASIDTDKEQYQFGQPVHINGSIRLIDGTPLVDEQIVLDLQLEPQLKEPVEVSTKNGGKYLATWHGEHIILLTTDANGKFTYDFYPAFGEAGLWHANVFAYKRGLGAGASTDFNIIGMVAVPSNASITSTKNSRFSKVINIKNASDEGGKTLTGINAVLVPLTQNSKVTAIPDSTNLKVTLAPGETTGVVINFNAPLDADDTAEYRIDFSSSEGAVASSTVKLNLRPAVPMPITDPRGIEVGLNPGQSIVRTIKLTNKGLGNMKGIKLESPARLPWITAGNLGKTELAPGESTTFEILINPSTDIPLGEYQDKVVVTDGKYSSTVTVASEISSAQSGSVSFIVSDDTGVRVPNAEVNLIGKQPFVQIKDGKEVTYYQHFYGRTDTNGVIVFENKPLGEYDYSVQASAHKSIKGNASVMPKTDAAVVNVTMEMLPVQVEWTVKPTTIQDKYDIKLEMTFGANIPKPYFGYVPPWINIPKQITDPMIVEATVVNCGLVAITDVTASILRENSNDTGISIIGGGYIGEIPAHGSVKIKLLVQPGYYNLRPGKHQETGLPYNAIMLHGYYVSFDRDTGLPIDPPEELSGNIALFNNAEQKVTYKASMPSGETVTEEIELPKDAEIEEVDYLIGRGDGKPALPESGQSGKGTYEIVTLSLDQTATLERQAFNATLKISNGYVAYALANMAVKVVVTDKDGKDVTGNNFIIATGLNGIENLDGSSSLLSGKSMTADWQIIPGDGLGGTNPEGEKYYAKAVLSYFVNGHYVETQTQAEEITIMPQPKINLHYYIPHDITANQTFKLGVTAENTGDGTAKNLVIDSGQLNIKSNQAGLQTKFEILGTSFGSNTESSFRLNLGDIAPHSQVTGYWIVKWSMYEEKEDAKPIEGEFLDFKASLHHQDYKGIQLNPLIVGVTTEIIGKDNLKLTADGDVSYTLIDKDNTGIPNYLINLKTGMKLPIYIPQTLNVTKQPDPSESTLKFKVPVPEGNPDDQGMPRYQVLMLKAPENYNTIRSVERESFVEGEEKRLLSLANAWIDYGNIYVVDEIPVSKVKPADSTKVQARYYYPSSYTVDFSSGAVISSVESAQVYYTEDKEKGPQYAYYDIGHYIDEGMTTSVRAEVTNKGKAVESGTVEFFAKRYNDKTETKIGEIGFSGIQPYNSKYAYTTWTPAKGGKYTLTARIKDSNTKDAKGEVTATINYRPIAETSADFSADVLTKAHFDSSRSYDKDGYIQAFKWDFGDGESGVGVCPSHKYLHSGTYKVKLTVVDNNNAESTSEMQVTIKETRADLRIGQLIIDQETLEEGQIVKITGTIQNAGYCDTKKPFLVGFYVDNKYVNYKRITDNIAPGGTKEVTFDWVNTKGNHIVTLIANDIGHPVDEADFDNNQKSRPINVSQAFFPNIKVDSFTADVSFDEALDWNQKVGFTANISNRGNANTGSFNVAFYVDDKLAETKTVQGLDYQDGANATKVTFTWNIKDEGKHIYKIAADGPLAHVVETDKNDNAKELEGSNIKLRYPDLKVESLSVSPDNGKLDAGQSVIINALISNNGYSTTSKQCKVAFFADGRYLGAKDVGIITKDGNIFASYTWDRPINGTKFIEAYADYNNDIHEVSDENNKLRYTVTTPMNINLPDLVIEGIATEPSSGTARFGDEVTTKVYLRNAGTAYIKTPFTTALYINKKLAGKFETKESLAPGQSTAGTVTWTADILPTAPDYELTAYADIYTKLVLSNRSHSTKTAYYKVKGEVNLAPDTINNAYTVGEKPKLKLKVNSTNEPGTPLTPGSGVKARINIYKGLPDTDGKSIGEAVYGQDMVYDELEGKYTSVVDIQNIGSILEPGQYTIEYAVTVGSDEKKICKAFKLVNDYVVTVNTGKQTYAANEPVDISGTVTDSDGKTPLAGVNVKVIVVGEEELKFNTITDENGKFNHKFQVTAGCGGSYSLKVSAIYDGAQKMSSSKVFYIEGPVLTFNNSIKITAGYSNTVPITLLNVGTLPITGITINKVFNEDRDGLTAEIQGEIPESLDAGKSAELKLKISAGVQTVPGIKDLELTAECKEGYTYKAQLAVTIEEPKPKSRIDIGGGVEVNEKALTSADYIVGAFKKEKITSSLRQGSTDTQVIHIMNSGNAPIRDIKVIPPATLPWVTITTSGTQLVEPVSKGFSIRDSNSHANILVHISPTDVVQQGIYEDYITITSNAGESKVPVMINVGASSVGTFVIQVLDEDSAPVNDAVFELSGPIAEGGKQDSNVNVYRGTFQGDATYKFENVPSGNYIAKVTAPYCKELECNFDVQALIELEPQKVYLEKMPFTLELSTESIIDTMNSDFKNGNTELVYKQVMKPEGAKPELISHYPGYEMYDSDMALNMSELISIKNSSDSGIIYDVQAKLKTGNTYLPKDAVSLIKGGADSATLDLDDFSAKDIKDLFIYVNDDKMCDIVKIQETDTPGKYTVIPPVGMTQKRINGWISDYSLWKDDGRAVTSAVYNTVDGSYTITLKPRNDGTYVTPSPKINKFYERVNFDFELELTGKVFNMFNMEEAVKLSIPIRLHFVPYLAFGDETDPRDEERIKVKAAFNPLRFKDMESLRVKEFSENFLKKMGKRSVEKPEAMGTALGSFDFSQDTVLADESFNADFSLFNPSDFQYINGADIELLITDMELDSEGQLPVGAKILNDKFNISLTKNIKNKDGKSTSQTYDDESVNIETIDPGSKLNVIFNILRKSMADNENEESVYSKKAYLYVKYKFTKDDETFSGITKSKAVEIEPPAKIYLSYEFKKTPDNLYEVTVKATNAGLGRARGLKLLPPVISSSEHVVLIEGKVEGGQWEQNISCLEFGDIAPNQTVTGYYHLLVSGDIDLAQSISFKVLDENSSGKVLLTPLTYNQVETFDFNDLRDELNRLKNNISGQGGLLDKSTEDLSRAMYESLEYVNSLDDARRTTELLDILNSGFGLIYSSINFFLSAKDIAKSYVNGKYGSGSGSAKSAKTAVSIGNSKVISKVNKALDTVNKISDAVNKAITLKSTYDGIMKLFTEAKSKLDLSLVQKINKVVNKYTKVYVTSDDKAGFVLQELEDYVEAKKQEGGLITDGNVTYLSKEFIEKWKQENYYNNITEDGKIYKINDKIYLTEENCKVLENIDPADDNRSVVQIDEARKSLSETEASLKKSKEYTQELIEKCAKYNIDGNNALDLELEIVEDVKEAEADPEIYQDGNVVYISKEYINKWKLKNGKTPADTEVKKPYKDGNVLYVFGDYLDLNANNTSEAKDALEKTKAKLKPALDEVQKAMDVQDEAFYNDVSGKIDKTLGIINSTLSLCQSIVDLNKAVDDIELIRRNLDQFINEANQALGAENSPAVDNEAQSESEEEEEEREEQKYGEYSVLFEGDAHVESERALLERLTATSSLDKLDSDLLKVAHHGSQSSTDSTFLQLVTPDESVISVGENNEYDHPSDITVSKLENIGSEVYRTDENGTVETEIYDESTNQLVAKVTVLDVNQGDCILIEAGGNRMLIDGGAGKGIYPLKAADFSRIDAIDSLKYLVITHPDSDHYNYLNKILFLQKPGKHIEVTDKVFIPEVDNTVTTPTYNTFEQNIKTRYNGQYVVVGSNMVGETIYLDDSNQVAFEFLGPVKNFYNDPELRYKEDKTNNSSIILKMTYKPQSQLMMSPDESGTSSSYAAPNNGIRIVTRYWVKEGDSMVKKQDVRKLIGSGTINIKDIAQYINKSQENSVFVKNMDNYKNWISNALGSMKDLKINNLDSVREKLKASLEQIAAAKKQAGGNSAFDVQKELDEIIKGMPDDYDARSMYIIQCILGLEEYKILTTNNMYNAYAKYLEEDHNIDEGFEDLQDYSDISPDIKLSKEYITKSVGSIKDVSDALMNEAIEIVENYIYNSEDAPSYYPTKVLLKYFNDLNEQIESIVGKQGDRKEGFGQYKNINVFNSLGDEVHPENKDLTVMKEQYLKLLKDSIDGYETIIDRWDLNISKAGLYSVNAILQPYNYVMGLNPIGSLLTLPTTYYYSKAIGAVNSAEMSIYKEENTKSGVISEDLANMVINTGLTFNREIGISESANNIIRNIDKWRKIDPPIPVEPVSISVSDITINDGEKRGFGEAVVILKNVHTGEVSALVNMDIFGGKLKYGSYTSDPVSIKPYETVVIKIPFEVQRSSLVDIAGYRSFVTISLSEPGTMSLGDPKGPYISHFYAGTEEQLNALRGNIKVVQPLGGMLDGGEEAEELYTASNNAQEIKIIMASKDSSKMQLHLYDKSGNHIGYVSGDGYKNSIPESEVISMRNNNDTIVIRNPHNGPYRIVVRLPEGENEEEYSLEVTELVNVGAIPDVDLPRVIISNTQNAEFIVNILESSYQNKIDNVEIQTGEFKDINGRSVPIIKNSFKAMNGTDLSSGIQSGIPVGMAAVVKCGVEFGEDLPDGIYNGKVNVTVKGVNLNPDFGRYLSVTDSVYGWKYNKGDGSPIRKSIRNTLLIYL